MPQMGVSVSEGTVTKWLKQVGEHDRGRRDAARDLDRQGRHRGAVARRPASSARSSSRRARRSTSARCSRGSAARPAPRRRPLRAASPRPRRSRRARAPSRRSAEPRRGSAAASRQPRRRRRTNGKSFVSPVVARIAAEHGIDPSQVPGTGPGGRVTKKDIQAFIDGRRRRRRTGGQLQPRRRQPPPAPAPAASVARRAAGSAGETLEPMTRDAPRDRRAHAPLARHRRRTSRARSRSTCRRSSRSARS